MVGLEALVGVLAEETAIIIPGVVEMAERMAEMA